jgi:hypothetical protein
MTPFQIHSHSKQLQNNSATSKQLQSNPKATLKQLQSNSKQRQSHSEVTSKWLYKTQKRLPSFGNENHSGRSYDQIGLIMLYASSCGEPSDQTSKNFFHIAHTWKAWHQCVCDDVGLAHQTGQIATRSLPTSTGMVSHLKIKEWKINFKLIFLFLKKSLITWHPVS